MSEITPTETPARQGGRPGLTYEEVKSACAELLDAGEKISARAIHAKTGGSMSTVIKHWHAWQDEVRSSADGPEVPETTLKALREALMAAYQQALAEGDEALATLRGEFQALGEALDEVERQLAESRTEAEAARADKALALSQTQAAEAALAQVKQDAAERMAEWQQRLSEVQQSLTQAQNSLNEEGKKVGALQGELRLLTERTAQLVTERDEARRGSELLRIQGEEARTEATSLRERSASLQQHLDQARGELAQALGQLQGLQVAHAALQTEMAALRTAAQKDADALDSERQRRAAAEQRAAEVEAERRELAAENSRLNQGMRQMAQEHGVLRQQVEESKKQQDGA